jgi:hypothetical protein
MSIYKLCSSCSNSAPACSYAIPCSLPTTVTTLRNLSAQDHLLNIIEPPTQGAFSSGDFSASLQSKLDRAGNTQGEKTLERERQKISSLSH